MQQIPQFTKSLDSASLSMEQIPKKKEQRADKICCGLYFSPGLDNLEKALFILKKNLLYKPAGPTNYVLFGTKFGTVQDFHRGKRPYMG